MFENPVEFVLQLAAFMFGACVGSFLNVCIYRWPLEMKVDEPKRSFCPKCKSAIPVWRNIPIFSWLLLRGKCGDCKAPIPVRYVLVELLTALGFLGLWLMYPSMLGVALIFFFVCCMVTVWVDFEHYIIPDQVSIKAVPIGLLCAALAPQLFGETEWYRGLMWGAVGAVAGYLLLWGVVELGSLIAQDLFQDVGDSTDPTQPENFPNFAIHSPPSNISKRAISPTKSTPTFCSLNTGQTLSAPISSLMKPAHHQPRKSFVTSSKSNTSSS